MNTALDKLPFEPEDRDEVPRCWSGEAHGYPGAFSFGTGVRPWNWMELDADDADSLFSLLSGFVAYFNPRYADRPEMTIPPCWTEHGCLVEELTTLFWARWHAFESRQGSIGGAQYWHSYTLPSFYERMSQWLGDNLIACQQGHHRDLEYRPVPTARSWELRTEIISSLDYVRRSGATSGEDSEANSAAIVVEFLNREGAQR